MSSAKFSRLFAVLVAMFLVGCDDHTSSGTTSSFASARSTVGNANPGQHLAVSHAFVLRLPTDDVAAVQQRHLSECARLGCSVVATRLDRSDDGGVHAHSTVRIAPDAFVSFATSLSTPPSEVVSHAENAEDKTLPLLDIEKRQETKAALRDRLTEMVRNQRGIGAADLATIERQLADVQGEIEAVTAQRDYLRTITGTVAVDIDYVGRGARAGGIDLGPVSRAINGFGRTLVTSIGVLISAVAAILPWIPAGLLAVWIIRIVLRRGKIWVGKLPNS